MMDFSVLFAAAKAGDADSISALIDMYQPLLKKYSIVNGKFDEDLFQELLIVLLDCIRRFNP